MAVLRSEVLVVEGSGSPVSPPSAGVGVTEEEGGEVDPPSIVRGRGGGRTLNAAAAVAAAAAVEVGGRRHMAQQLLRNIFRT